MKWCSEGHKSAFPGKLTCFRCGKEGHAEPKCRFKDSLRHNCGKKDISVCRSKSKKLPSKKVNTIEQKVDEELEY